MRVHLSCPMCNDKHEIIVNTPKEWRLRRDDVDVEDSAFCPKHAGVVDFLKDQCPGCVCSFGECPLTDSYAYGARRTLTEDDLNVMEHQGRCPKRVNGTFSVGAGGESVIEINLSERSESGAAMAGAIRDYITRWPSW